MLDSKLVFEAVDGPAQGFNNVNANRENTKDDEVVRELLQNCLDAKSNSNSACIVTLILTQLPRREIPFIDDYELAFRASKDYRSSDETATGKQTIDRIQQALDKAELESLICIDRGDGIGYEQLRALYGSGVSRKTEGNRGSVGHGHLTAFAPSNLRFVLYAGREANGQTTFGGQAILAKHVIEKRPRQAQGYIRQVRNDDQVSLFDEERGGIQIPTVIEQYLPEQSGSVVAILGYQPIEEVDPINLLQSASVQHFLVALYSDRLRVEISGAKEGTLVVNRQGILHAIEKIRKSQIRQKILRSFTTLTKGEFFDSPSGLRGVRVWFRNRIDNSEGPKSKVSIYRDGMWIDDNTLGFLTPTKFSAKLPFDAVVDLNSKVSGSFGALAREAEGASHLKITPSEIRDKAKRGELHDYLNGLREFLLSKAEERPNPRNVYIPQELLLNGGGIRKLQARRFPTYQPDDDSDYEDEAPSQDSEGENGPFPPNPYKPGLENTKQRVSPGENKGIYSSCRPDRITRGLFRVTWKRDENSTRAEELELRMCLPSGTDRTSYNPIRATRLELKKVKGNSATLPISENGLTARIPATLTSIGEGKLEVLLNNPSTIEDEDLSLVRAEIVRRSHSKSKSQEIETKAT